MTDSECVDYSPINPIESWSNLQLHDYAWLFSGLFSLIATILSFYLMYKHYVNYTQPQYQRYIVRIILIVPIYGTTSWLSFRYYRAELYLDVIRDCYEAFVIYSFFTLLLNYLGEDEEAQREVLADKPIMKNLFPLNCIRYDPKSKDFLPNCRHGTLQYAVVRPLTTILSVITLILGVYCPDSLNMSYAHPYIEGINTVAVTIAMWVLVTFYFTVKDVLAPYKPISKFLSVKFVIFFSFWQEFTLAVLQYFNLLPSSQYWSSTHLASGLQDGLVCIEMLIASIMHLKAYSYKEYISEDGEKTNIIHAIRDSINPLDIYEDCRYGVKHMHGVMKKKKRVVTAKGKALLKKANVFGSKAPEDQDGFGMDEESIQPYFTKHKNKLVSPHTVVTALA